jgi:hypothetical protein
MKWACSEGGPLLLLGLEGIESWGGYEAPLSFDGADIPGADAAICSDYDRACGVTGYLGIIDVGARQGIVLADEPLATTWIPFPAGTGGMLVRWMFAQNEAALLNSLESLPDSVFRSENVHFLVDKPPLVLFDSALPGHSVIGSGEYLIVAIDPGKYSIETAIYSPNERTGSILHRLALQP